MLIPNYDYKITFERCPSDARTTLVLAAWQTAETFHCIHIYSIAFCPFCTFNLVLSVVACSAFHIQFPLHSIFRLLLSLIPLPSTVIIVFGGKVFLALGDGFSSVVTHSLLFNLRDQ